jgi:hypothetical protein
MPVLASCLDVANGVERGRVSAVENWGARLFVLVTTLLGCDGGEAESHASGGGGQRSESMLPSAQEPAGAGAGGAGTSGGFAIAHNSGAGVGGAGSAAISGGGGGAGIAAAAGGRSGASGMRAGAAGSSGVLAPVPASPAGMGATGGAPEAGATAPAEWPSLEAEQFGTPTLVSDAFDLAESPLWDHCHDRLLFTDVNKRTIHTLSLGGEVGVLISDSNYVNGMAFDSQGNLLMAEMGGGRGGRITRMNRDKQIEVLIDHDPAGNPLRTSDDLVLRSDGTIYFSDPVISHGPFTAGLSTLGTYPFYRLKPPAADGTREVVRGGAGFVYRRTKSACTSRAFSTGA